MNKNEIILEIPTKETLYFKKEIKEDPNTMDYNAGYDLNFSGYNREDGTMYRDVIGLKNKIYCKFEDPELRTGENLDNLLYLISLSSMNVNYYDRRKKSRVTKSMYFVVDKIELNPCEINDDYIAEPFEARFIQMTIDSVN